MQLCPKCGKPIHWITKDYDTVIVCEGEPVTVYKESGRTVEGYLLHKCKEMNNGKSEERNGSNNG